MALGLEQRTQELMDAEDGLDILEATAEAEAAISTERRRRIQVDVAARLVDVDPFAVLGVQAAPGRWGGVPMTEKQQAARERAGLPPRGLDRGQASAMIGAPRHRMDAKLCTYKQAKGSASATIPTSRSRMPRGSSRGSRPGAGGRGRPR